MKSQSRRKFLKDTLTVSTVLAFPGAFTSCTKKGEIVRLGMIADVHYDLIPDGKERLQAFISESHNRELDFIIQMGDFCIPYPENQPFLDVFNSYDGNKYHVLGNHDMDGGFTRERTMEFWGMHSKFYSFDCNGVHFIVLDGNDPNPQPFEGYNRYIGPAQLEWLQEDLEGTTLPTFIFSHQTLENEDGGVANMAEVRALLEQHNKAAGFTKIIACVSGHHHTDYHTSINGIYYIQINSSSYRWVGGDYKVRRYSDELHKKYKWLEHMIPYQDPLYTYVTIDSEGYLTIESKMSSFMGPGPDEMGMPPRPENDPIVPYISGRNLEI